MSENKKKIDANSRERVWLKPQDKNLLPVIQGIVADRTGKKLSNAEVVTDALKFYLKSLKEDAGLTLEHARLGAAIMAALEKWKASDAKVAGLVVDQINFVLDVAAEEMGQ